MSQFNWPHPAYAEDQPYAKALLYVHVFHRGYEIGSGFGLLSAAYKIRKSIRSSASTASPPPPASRILWPTIGKASFIGGGVTMALLTMRMWGLEEIEWQDRSWRLLENKGQVMHDRYCDWGVGLGVAGAVIAKASSGGKVRILSMETAGRAGLGAVVGAVACEVVRAVS